MKKYNVALIGCGQMGTAHLEKIYYKKNVNIEYVCDLDISKAEFFKRKFNARKAVTESDECINDENVDIVIIAVYPSLHLSMLEKCLQYKKHVICEKPIAANKKDGDRFIKALKSHPESKVLIGHILRHNKTYQKAANLIQSGVIGKPIVMRMVQNHHIMNSQRYLTLLNETSPIIDCGVHYMDVMQWFTSEKIIDVQGMGARIDNDIPQDKYDYGIATVKLSGGSIGYYEAGWTNALSATDTKEFVGPLGRIKIIYAKDRYTNSEEGDLIELYKYPDKSYETINIQCDRKPCGDQFDYLINMIENNVPPVPTIDEIHESFNAVLQADVAIKKFIKIE